ncbi:MAG: peptide ABC transporter substrate-binding protein [Coleofasciculaceae cyanobacterium RL_1_1]|nr:peptide ABC transporter substrate-binding protein [Coleofasciculaceae cyanobacterium RL_1_1]
MRLRSRSLPTTLFASLATLAIGLSACIAPEVSETAGDRLDRIEIGTTSTVVTLDPADAYDQASNVAIYNLGDRLYRYQADSTAIEPSLATALPQISDDGLTYTIPIRQGVSFHDGTDFNAEAMAFSLRRFIENKGRAAFLLADLVESIEATGEYELTIKLAYSFPAFTDLLTYPGLCAISPAAYTIAEGDFEPNTFVGTGPYRLADYGGDNIKLDAFEDYWGTPPQNDGIVLQRFSSAANLYNAFRSNGIDVAYQALDPDQIRSLIELADQPKGGWQVFSSESPSISYLVINAQQPPFDRVEVRQALAAAIDRDLINERVFYGQAQPLYSLIPPSFLVSEPVFAERYGTTPDLDRAKALLTAAGFSQDKPLTLEIWYGSNSPSSRLAAIVMQAHADRYLDGLLKIDPHSVEAATAYGYLDKGVYPSFVLSWYADFFDPDNYLKPFLDCTDGSVKQGCVAGESQYHGSFFFSDRANELLAAQRSESDPTKRAAMLDELQTIVADDVPYLPLWQSKDYAFAQSDIDGVQLNATQQILPFSSLQRMQTEPRGGE